MTALILSFDGLIADTLDARVESLQFALSAEGVHVEPEHLRTVLPGRTLQEATTALIGDRDQTIADIAALRAQQDLSMRLAHGVSLEARARPFVDAQRNAGTKLVLRADSLRRDVDRILQLTDLEHAFTFVRCADDRPRARGATMLEGAYAAITDRLDSLGVRDRRAVECSAEAADIARRFIGRAESARYLDASTSRR